MNTNIMKVLEGKERTEELQSLFEEIMAENFPNLKREIKIQIHAAEKLQVS